MHEHRLFEYCRPSESDDIHECVLELIRRDGAFEHGRYGLLHKPVLGPYEQAEAQHIKVLVTTTDAERVNSHDGNRRNRPLQDRSSRND
jgi:hypothetical protein